MKFGVCANLSKAGLLAELGFDYIEGHVTDVAAMSEGEFDAACAAIESSPIKAEAFCVLFPGSIKVTGPEVDMSVVSSYLTKAFPRIRRLGAEVVVFGSGGARRVPDGFDRAYAWHQLVQVSRLIAEKAEENGIVVALEPLNVKETNIINSQLEGLRLVADVDRPAFKILSDFYHLNLAGEDRAEVCACRGLLVHTHIANPVGRVCMKLNDAVSYSGFFAGLADVGYNGRLSIEGKIADDRIDLPEGLEVMRRRAAEAGITK